MLKQSSLTTFWTDDDDDLRRSVQPAVNKLSRDMENNLFSWLWHKWILACVDVSEAGEPNDAGYCMNSRVRVYVCARVRARQCARMRSGSGDWWWVWGVMRIVETIITDQYFLYKQSFCELRHDASTPAVDWAAWLLDNNTVRVGVMNTNNCLQPTPRYCSHCWCEQSLAQRKILLNKRQRF